MNLKENIRNARLVVYTAIVGGYDELHRPEVIDDNVDYVCFTDDPGIPNPGPWQLREMTAYPELDQTRRARYYKLCPHVVLPEYDYSLWMDGNLIIRGSLRAYIEAFAGERPMLCQRHFDRDCLYDEAAVVVSSNADDPKLVRDQITRFRLEGFPSHCGLTASNALLRAHNDPAVVRVMEEWWKNVRNGSRRDQLSFSYAAWKNGFSYDATPLHCYDNPYWVGSPHKKQLASMRAHPTVFQRIGSVLRYLFGR